MNNTEFLKDLNFITKRIHRESNSNSDCTIRNLCYADGTRYVSLTIRYDPFKIYCKKYGNTFSVAFKNGYVYLRQDENGYKASIPKSNQHNINIKIYQKWIEQTGQNPEDFVGNHEMKYINGLDLFEIAPANK